MAAPAKTLGNVGMKKLDKVNEWTNLLPRRGKQNRKSNRPVSSTDQEPVHAWTPLDVKTNPERENKLLQKMKICIQKVKTSQFWKSLLNQMGSLEFRNMIWTIVLPRRRKQNQKANRETNREREKKLLEEMEICIQKVELSQFWKSLLNQMESPEFQNRIFNMLGTEASMKMVVYGIGSIESHDPPRLQLGVVILMKRYFGWIGDIEVFDPIISLTESKVMDSLGCSVLSFNERCRRQALRPTFFFMPHCDADLYDNLLQVNWTTDMLTHIVLLGNNFYEYEHFASLFPSSAISLSAKHILAVRKFTNEVRVCACFDDDYYRAFQGLSWHFFNLDSESDSLL